MMLEVLVVVKILRSRPPARPLPPDDNGFFLHKFSKQRKWVIIK
ncbi:MAG: hypothetical protein WAO23_02860 [Dethiobacteria bacterium]